MTSHHALVAAVLLALAAPVAAQQTTLPCPGGHTSTTTVAGLVTVVCTPLPPPPPPPPPPTGGPVLANVTADPQLVDPGQATILKATLSATGQAPLAWAVTLLGKPVAIVAVTPTSGRIIAPLTPGDAVFTVTVTDALKRSSSRAVTVTVRAAPPPPAPAIFGVVDETPDKLGLTVFGTCTKALHDTYVLLGPDGVRYRTWHPAVDPSGCTWGHEHGDDPAKGIAELVAEAKRLNLPAPQQAAVARPILFGYIGRRMLEADGQPHEEAHEGFKIFAATRGVTNDDKFTNRTTALHVTHFGTFRPRRASTRFHSVETRQIHEDHGVFQITQLMLDSGDIDAVCDPRFEGLRKDVVQLNQRCKSASLYEIWLMAQSLIIDGREVGQVFATPASFDPSTAINPANRDELIYIDDPRVNDSLQFPGNDRSGSRDCVRETYAQMPVYHNLGGATTYVTDVMGKGVPASDPLGVEQHLSAIEGVGPASTFTQFVPAFKHKVNYCVPGLSWKN